MGPIYILLLQLTRDGDSKAFALFKDPGCIENQYNWQPHQYEGAKLLFGCESPAKAQQFRLLSTIYLCNFYSAIL